MASTGTKPASRIQSRPLSSSTITPSTPKRPHTAHPVFDSSQSTPKPSAARQKLHDLFGIPLGRKSSSRSRSRSRPSSPHASLDIPPLPISDDTTPRPGRSSSPHVFRQPSPSPTPPPRLLRVTNATPSLASTAPSLKLPKFLSGKSYTKQIMSNLFTFFTSIARNTSTFDHTRTSENTFGASSVPPLVSAPLKRVSSLQRHSLKPINYVVGDPRVAQSPPQIVHTPATPLKTTRDAKDTATSRLGYHAVKHSLDSAYKYHGATMGVVDEESRAELASKSSTIVGPEPVPRPSYKKMSSSVRPRKHGSFDFEKPGWGAPQIQRNGSNDTTTSEWSKNNESLHKERDSTYGPGLAGVGTLQRDVSVKRAQEREEKTRLKDLTRKQPVPTAKSTNPMPHVSLKHSDPVHNSTSTTGKSNTGTEKSLPNTGKSSSMSKASGKRALHATKTRSGSGVARLIGLTTQHGPFSFEPAVPSANRSTGSNGTSHEPRLSRSKTEKEKERIRDEKERQQFNRKRGDRPPVPVPMPSTNAGHRSGTKGRSLDLGLGLAWAPSKVREEALLPSSTFFARSISNSSSKRSRSGSTATGASSSTTGNGSGRSKGGMMNQDPDVERSKLGKEVAELFRHAVDPEGYKAFRKCEFFFPTLKILVS